MNYNELAFLNVSLFINFCILCGQNAGNERPKNLGKNLLPPFHSIIQLPFNDSFKWCIYVLDF